MRVRREQLGLTQEGMARDGLSASRLRRYEKGQEPRPTMAVATDLDRLYQADGWIELSLAQLLDAGWDPWREDWPADSHICTWPADLQSDVWVHVKPRHDTVDHEHAFVMSWGPWHRQHTTALGRDGEYLVTGKQRDEGGYRTEFRIACAEHSFHIRHGAGLPPSNTAKVVDIRLGWERHVPEPPAGIEPR